METDALREARVITKRDTLRDVAIRLEECLRYGEDTGLRMFKHELKQDLQNAGGLDENTASILRDW